MYAAVGEINVLKTVLILPQFLLELEACQPWSVLDMQNRCYTLLYMCTRYLNVETRMKDVGFSIAGNLSLPGPLSGDFGL